VSAAPEELREEVSGLVVRAVAHDVREHADLRQMSRDCLSCNLFMCVCVLSLSWELTIVFLFFSFSFSFLFVFFFFFFFKGTVSQPPQVSASSKI
jgi:hypothetical protein